MLHPKHKISVWADSTSLFILSCIKASQQFSQTSIWCSCRSHLALIRLQTTESDCLDVHIVSPAANTVVSFWWSSVRRDKTYCFGFSVMCVLHWLPHSEGSTVWSSHHTFELNKLPHKHKRGIVLWEHNHFLKNPFDVGEISRVWAHTRLHGRFYLELKRSVD